MKRQVSLSEISDGRLYESNDMAKIDCGGCADCHACCKNMGTSVILDPLDIAQLTGNLRCTFESLLNGKIELNVVDGVILPNLAMSVGDGQCAFLDKAGRCSIHSFRPGICRLFPLGRYYENHSFKYFIQVHECRKENRGKMKIYKWLDIKNLKKYEQYVLDWHYFLNSVETWIEKASDASIKKVDMYILKMFYMTPYDGPDFYQQFYERLGEVKKIIRK